MKKTGKKRGKISQKIAFSTQKTSLLKFLKKFF